MPLKSHQCCRGSATGVMDFDSRLCSGLLAVSRTIAGCPPMLTRRLDSGFAFIARSCSAAYWSRFAADRRDSLFRARPERATYLRSPHGAQRRDNTSCHPPMPRSSSSTSALARLRPPLQPEANCNRALRCLLAHHHRRMLVRAWRTRDDLRLAIDFRCSRQPRLGALANSFTSGRPEPTSPHYCRSWREQCFKIIIHATIRGEQRLLRTIYISDVEVASCSGVGVLA
jgi:hypothetical protein